MKNKLSFVLCIMLCLVLISCSSYKDDYENDYKAGYNEGHQEGFKDAQAFVEDELFSLECDIRNDTSLFLDEAIEILEDYAEGKSIAEKDLNQAIWTISQFYSGAHDIIREIEDNWWAYD